MTGFLVNLLSPVFSSLGVSQADLTSYIEKLIGYVIAILALLVVMIVWLWLIKPKRDSVM